LISVTDKSEFYIHDFYKFTAIHIEIAGKTKPPSNILIFNNLVLFIVELDVYSYQISTEFYSNKNNYTNDPQSLLELNSQTALKIYPSMN
jgi:hypothetical protein